MADSKMLRLLLWVSLLLTAFGHIQAEVNDASVNSETLFEGDIAGINVDSFVAYLRGEVARNGKANGNHRWEGGIVPYDISSEFRPFERNIILKAMKGFHNSTCVQFFERTDEKNYLYIYPGNSGCWSFIGFLGSGQQTVGLQQSQGCLTHGIVQHELMHALGFYHEQSRADRDDYVDIISDNIKSRDRANFEKYTDVEVDAFGQPYDFGSILHYGTHDFAKNLSSPTIKPKDRYSKEQIGQRNGLSEIDIRKINLMYECNKCSETNPRQATPTRNVTLLGTRTQTDSQRFVFAPTENERYARKIEVKFSPSLDKYFRLSEHNQETVGWRKMVYAAQNIQLFSGYSYYGYFAALTRNESNLLARVEWRFNVAATGDRIKKLSVKFPVKSVSSHVNVYVVTDCGKMAPLAKVLHLQEVESGRECQRFSIIAEIMEGEVFTYNPYNLRSLLIPQNPGVAVCGTPFNHFDDSFSSYPFHVLVELQ